MTDDNGSSITINGAGRSVTMTGAQLKQLANDVSDVTQSYVDVTDVFDVEWSADGLSVQKTREVYDLVFDLFKGPHEQIAGVRVLVVWRLDAKKKCGQTVLASVRKASAMDRLFCPLWWRWGAPDFILEVSIREWIDASAAKRRAVIDHQLCHIGRKPRGGYELREHDFQEFRAVIERHGPWLESLEDAKEAFVEYQQQSLFDAVERVTGRA